VFKALTETWIDAFVTNSCAQTVIFPDENPRTSGVCPRDEHSNEGRATLCHSGSPGAVRIMPDGTRFLTNRQLAETH